jgi:DNA-binding CsgD family transcriptional regulator
MAEGRTNLLDVAAEISVPTLVIHARRDAAVPFSEGRLVAGTIPDARLVQLESRSHVLLPTEPAWSRLVDEVGEFLGSGEPPAMSDLNLTALSAREREVLALVAEGLSNEQVAADLVLSERTVERHLSNIYAKAGVSGKAARVAVAARFSRENPR